MDKTPSQEMLAHAEKLCAQRGVRLTPQRLEVLRLMSLQQGAISAYDLLDLLREKRAAGEAADGLPCAGVFTRAGFCP
ncbi:Zinc uptake regulation protein ZUR [Klebsiella pneumoniae IS43]|uniref:Zinc uptake regulation protein ZUR n=1 Tax=Klebsiella pneumoniae IS43 TaxID=1432552 RepID=W1DS06_KLEPN|nr:Zinc uptake regulation protein ZUR [Klebsiella pneumoniae IS43]